MRRSDVPQQIHQSATKIATKADELNKPTSFVPASFVFAVNFASLCRGYAEESSFAKTADDNKSHPYLQFFTHSPRGKHKNHNKQRSDLPGGDKKHDQQKVPKDESRGGDGERVAKVRQMSCSHIRTFQIIVPNDRHSSFPPAFS